MTLCSQLLDLSDATGYAPKVHMAFQGSLKELPLPDIIQLVSVSGKTGKFTLTREGDRGYIYLKNGQMVHALVSDLVGEEAIFSLAIWNQGEFQFNPAEEPDRQTITKSNTKDRKSTRLNSSH